MKNITFVEVIITFCKFHYVITLFLNFMFIFLQCKSFILHRIFFIDHFELFFPIYSWVTFFLHKSVF